MYVRLALELCSYVIFGSLNITLNWTCCNRHYEMVLSHAATVRHTVASAAVSSHSQHHARCSAAPPLMRSTGHSTTHVALQLSRRRAEACCGIAASVAGEIRGSRHHVGCIAAACGISKYALYIERQCPVACNDRLAGVRVSHYVRINGALYREATNGCRAVGVRNNGEPAGWKEVLYIER